MSLARTLLLRASRSEWLAEQFRTRSFARRAVRRFMPGERSQDALQAARAFSDTGIGSVFTNLGERVSNRGEANGVRDHYLSLLDDIHTHALRSEISVKLTHLGLDLDTLECLQRVQALARRAEERGSFVWIDIEESHYVDSTIEIFRQARGASPNLGLCLQAYLKRTMKDAEALLPLKPAIRLVKGAYQEPATIAYQKKDNVDAAYATLGRQMLELAAQGRMRPVFGTHDMALVEQMRAKASELRLAADAWEVHMLYGIRTIDQRRLASAGVKVRVLISYGTHWFPWYVRRLAERPANLWFVARNVLGG